MSEHERVGSYEAQIERGLTCAVEGVLTAIKAGAVRSHLATIAQLGGTVIPGEASRRVILFQIRRSRALQNHLPYVVSDSDVEEAGNLGWEQQPTTTYPNQEEAQGMRPWRSAHRADVTLRTLTPEPFPEVPAVHRTTVNAVLQSPAGRNHKGFSVSVAPTKRYRGVGRSLVRTY